MIDPISVAGLASAILTFVDFAKDVLGTGYELSRSTGGDVRRNLDLEIDTGELYSLNRSLSRPLASVSGMLSQDEQVVQTLAARSKDLAEDLLGLLEDLRVEGKGLSRTRNMVRKSISTVRSKKQIEDMRTRLEKIGARVDTRLLSILRSGQSQIYAELHSLVTSSKHAQQSTLQRLEEAKQELLTAARMQEVRLADLAARLTQIDEVAAKGAKAEMFLRSLAFDELSARISQVDDAYEGTYSWVLDDQDSPFRVWLENSAGIFWISGKAGSGKSTLMKYILSQIEDEKSDARRLLRQWAGTRRVFTASYFFWGAGSDMQKSQQGLMQSLLYQLLRQCPELAAVACPSRWKDLDLSKFDQMQWRRQELTGALRSILSRGPLKSRFCFFIDGLDEYRGEPYEIVKDLQLFMGMEDVKICISSRPWTEFCTAYSRPNRYLKMEYLTAADMETYVHGTVERTLHSFGRTISAHELATLQSFMRDIAEAADGVFLWVVLAVRSLLSGFSKFDEVDELRQRLKQIPGDLKKFFQQILNSVEPMYQQLMARALLIVLHGVNVPAAALHFLKEDRDDSDFAFGDLEDRAMYIDVSLSTYDGSVTATRINKWTRGLLEIVDSGYYGVYDNVEFIHRTLSDYIRDVDTYEELRSRAGFTCGAQLMLLRLHLAWLKAVIQETRKTPAYFLFSQRENLARQYDVARRMMEVSNDCPQRDGQAVVRILDEMDRICGKYSGDKDLRWTRLLAEENSMVPQHESFARFAACYGLEVYTKAKLLQMDKAALRSEGPYLLDAALRQHYRDTTKYASTHRKRWPEARMSLPIVEALLKYGVDSEQEIQVMLGGPAAHGPEDANIPRRHRASVWHCFLLDCLTHPLRYQNEKDFVSIVQLLVQNGVDPELEYRNGANISECLSLACPRQQLQELDATLTRHATPKQQINQCSDGDQIDGAGPMHDTAKSSDGGKPARSKMLGRLSTLPPTGMLYEMREYVTRNIVLLAGTLAVAVAASCLATCFHTQASVAASGLRSCDH